MKQWLMRAITALGMLVATVAMACGSASAQDNNAGIA